MAKLIVSLLAVWVLQVALVSALCCGGHSPYEYDIDKQMTYRDNVRNLVAGWRQYEDKLLYR
jgi:hypothetical protein